MKNKKHYMKILSKIIYSAHYRITSVTQNMYDSVPTLDKDRIIT